MLDYYAKHFDTVELNNTFYRLPTETAVDGWRTAVPANFVFAVKASRFLTHRIKLKDPERALNNFFPAIEPLGRRLGPVLFQLPPQLAVNVERLSALLASLPRRRRYAFEFRHDSWHSDDVYAVLQKYNAAICMYELAGYASPLEVTADFAYVRLHGPGAKYQGSYTSTQLVPWAARLTEWARRLRAIYVYFDNDQAGYAAKNAAQLKHLMRRKREAA
jgi:uncharacterized protein YecE (DUF72 family)